MQFNNENGYLIATISNSAVQLQEESESRLKTITEITAPSTLETVVNAFFGSLSDGNYFMKIQADKAGKIIIDASGVATNVEVNDFSCTFSIIDGVVYRPSTIAISSVGNLIGYLFKISK